MKPKQSSQANLSSSSLRSQSSTLSNLQDNDSSLRTSKTQNKKRRSSFKHMLVGSKRFKVSVKILREIKRLQTSTKLLLPRSSFSRLVREIMLEYAFEQRIQRTALQALQEALETYIVQYFEDAYACTLHARRSTLIPRDIILIQYLRR